MFSKIIIDKIINSFLTLTLLSLGSCISSSILQTAKPLQKGEVETAISLSGFANSEIVGGVMSESQVRVGLNDVSDIGFSFALPTIGHYKIDYKRLLYKNTNETFYLSSGVGIEAFLPSESDPFIPGITIPLYISFNDKGKITPYLAQRFTFSPIGLKTHRYLSLENPVEKNVFIKNHMITSGGIGLRFTNYEKNRRWFIEFSYYLHSEYFYRSDFNSNTQSWKKTTRSGIGTIGAQVNLGFNIMKPFKQTNTPNLE